MNDHVILLIEDNADDELLTMRALKKGRISNKIDVARDGAEALEYLFATGKFSDRRKSDLPQLVLLDLKLPKVDGIEVLKQIRANERTQYLPVVILTSSNEEKDVAAAYASGVNSYVVKPVDSTQFTEAVQQLGLYWLVINESPPN
ncbi:MAG: response regulator [Bdellovibrionota bacterium]